MKILQVEHQFLPKHIGGTELYVKNISSELVKSGNEVMIFSGEGEVLYHPAAKENTYNDLKIISLGNKRSTPDKRHHFFFTFNNPSVVNIFEHVIDNFHPDVIHTVTIYKNMSLRTSIYPGDSKQQSGLSAAAGTDNPQDLSRTDFKRYILYRFCPVKVF